MGSMQNLEWSVHEFSELGVELLYAILRLRVDVFVIEQECPYPEVDGQDQAALHLVATDVHGTLAAYARILPLQGDGYPHIGRVVIPKEYRGTGLGKHLMQEAFNVLRERYGSARSAIAAQTHLQKFYMDLGYIRTSEDYLWDGIPHVDMVLNED